MNMKLALVLMLFALFSSMLYTGFNTAHVKATNGSGVENLDTGFVYSTIQEAINAASPGDTLSVHEGIYNENVVVNKSLSLIGQNKTTTIIDGGGSGDVVLVTAGRVAVKGFTVRNGVSGINVKYSNNSVFSENIVANNTERGILVSNSWNSTVSFNEVYGTFPFGYGIHANVSINAVIAGNIVHDNYYDGVGLLRSNSSLIAGNDVFSNTLYNVWVSYSYDNLVYRNNFKRVGFNPGRQASSDTITVWDDGVEGNYWSNYTGIDSNQDGIGDTPYTIDASNKDNHPLAGRFSSFNASLGYSVNVVSNSSISGFTFNASDSTIKMRVSNSSTTQTGGFCRVRIPHAVLIEPFNVTVDGANPAYWNYSLYDDGSNRWIYFTYAHSVHEVVIQGTQPPDTTPPVISIVSPKNRTYSTIFVPLNFSLSEPANWTGYSLDGQANTTITGNTTIGPLSDGSHHVTVYANDTVGNMGRSSTVYFSIDSTPPSVSVISPENKTYTVADISLTFTVAEPVSWIGYSFDGQANVTVTGNTTLYGLADGLHSLTVCARDAAGNTGASETVYFSVNTKQPEPFPWWILAAIVGAAAVAIAVVLYLVKIRKPTKKTKE